MAFTGQVNWYLSTNKYSAVTAWDNNGGAGRARSVGDIVKQSGTPTAGNERCYVYTVAGTGSTTTDPFTSFTRGVIITDGSATAQECTGVAAMNGDLTNTPTWTAGAKAVSNTLGHVIKSDDGTKTLICSQTGTGGSGAEPAWGTTLGAEITDNGAKWRLLKISSNKFANWAAPAARLRNAMAANWGGTNAGQKCFVGNSHSATEAANIDPYTANNGTGAAPLETYCVSEAGSIPPVAADLTTGAVEEVTGSSRISMSGFLRIYGLTFRTTSTGSVTHMLCNATGDKFLENCRIECTGNAGATDLFRNSTGNVRWILKDCTIKFGNTSQGINVFGGYIFDNLAIDTSLATPTVLFLTPTSNGQWVVVRNSDLSAFSGALFTTGNQICSKFFFENCKLNATTTFVSGQGNSGLEEWHFYNCDSGGTNYKHTVKKYSGDETTDITVVRDTGAQNPDSQSLSYKLVTTANAGKSNFFDLSKFSGWNSVTGHDVLATVYGIVNAAAMPTVNDVWGQTSYLGSASSPLHSKAYSATPNPLSTTSLTADTSDWDNNATARQNSHAYSVGDVFRVGSNPGRVFFCTTAGTTAGSEPGGYASAIDGGSVTDNTAVFRAGWRFKLQMLCTSPSPAQQGMMTAAVHVHLASTTFYFDPLVDLEQSSS